MNNKTGSPKIESKPPRINSRPNVHQNAQIADDVVIAPYATVEANVTIGRGTEIASHALIASGTAIGKNCQIHHGAVLGTLPQYLGFDPNEKTTLEIGDNTIIREYCTLSRGTKHRRKTTVGSNCFIMAYVHIAHDCVIGNNVILANAINMAGHVIIEDFAGIGGMVPIHQFVRIGSHSFIGGGFRVPKDVPPYILASGAPLTYAGINSIGLERRGFQKETLAQIKRAYRIIYRSKLNVSQALEKIKNEMDISPEIQTVITFIENCERGIIK